MILLTSWHSYKTKNLLCNCRRKNEKNKYTISFTEHHKTLWSKNRLCNYVYQIFVALNQFMFFIPRKRFTSYHRLTKIKTWWNNWRRRRQTKKNFGSNDRINANQVFPTSDANITYNEWYKLRMDRPRDQKTLKGKSKDFFSRRNHFISDFLYC